VKGRLGEMIEHVDEILAAVIIGFILGFFIGCLTGYKVGIYKGNGGE